jgi:formate hydrogenlyase subunit 3/multisubunit Na+/H+ antiporter MnhD subunit
MTLGNPILIGIYSLALLSIGAAIGVRWGHSAHTAIWMVLIGAVLMVIHDMLTGIVLFLSAAAWASRNQYSRNLRTTSMQDATGQLTPTPTLNGRPNAKARETD